MSIVSPDSGGEDDFEVSTSCIIWSLSVTKGTSACVHGPQADSPPESLPLQLGNCYKLRAWKTFVPETSFGDSCRRRKAPSDKLQEATSSPLPRTLRGGAGKRTKCGWEASKASEDSSPGGGGAPGKGPKVSWVGGGKGTLCTRKPGLVAGQNPRESLRNGLPPRSGFTQSEIQQFTFWCPGTLIPGRQAFSRCHSNIFSDIREQYSTQSTEARFAENGSPEPSPVYKTEAPSAFTGTPGTDPIPGP